MTTASRFPFKQAGHALPALEERLEEVRVRLGMLSPSLLAERSGAGYRELGQGRGEFHLMLLGGGVILTHPDFRAINAATDEKLPAFKHALALYYFLQSDGTPQTGRWISFAELPEGRIYASAFQGYTGDEISKAFRLDLEVFHAACRKAGGTALALGEAAYQFQALPRMTLAAVYHLGDEDFPSTCRILFDASAGHYLPAEACAILGSMLTQKILRAR